MSGHDETHNGFQDKRLDRLEDGLLQIKDNHLVHLATALHGIKLEVSEVKTDVKWLKESWWKLAIPGILAIISVMIQTLIKQ